MGWDGGGNVTLLYDFTADRDAGSPSNVISATKFDAQFDDLATAIEATLNINGENTIAAHINWGGYKITSLSDPAAATDAINASSVAENTVQYGGTTGGTANAQTVTNTFIATVGTGTRLLCIAGATNTGACTLNVNSAGAVAIVQRDGSTALTGGEIVSGDLFEVVYDGTSFVLINNPTLVGSYTITNNTDSASVQVLRLDGDRATMADNDEGYISMYLSDDGGTQTEMARMTWIATDVTDTTEDGNLQFSVMIAGTLTDHLQLSSTALYPVTTDAIALGTSSLNFSDLFLDSGAVINFDSGDVTITHAANALTIAGGSLTVSGGFAATISPTSSDGAALGTASLMWSDVFIASGGVVNFNAGDVTITHSANALTVAGGSLSVSSAATYFYDSTFYATSDGTDPQLYFDTGDYLWYDRSANIPYLNIGGTDKKVLVQQASSAVDTSTAATDYTVSSIPAGIDEIIIHLEGVSASDGSDFFIQIGDSGGIETTGYNGGGIGNTGTYQAYSIGYRVTDNSAAGSNWYGRVHLTRAPGTNNWSCISAMDSGSQHKVSGGTKILSAELDRINLTTTNGTATFDAGTMYVYYR